MARPRNPKRDEAFNIWIKSKGKILLKDIAKQLDLSDSQIRKWKNQDKWDEKINSNVTNSKSNVTKSNKKRYPNGHPGNKNPLNKFSERNQAAKKHGLFSRYMPKDTLEIIEALEHKSPADMLWDQIVIQYAAILRSQEIMHVESKNEIIKELKKEKQQAGKSGSTWEEEYELQFAWDRQAQFLQAQSRAITELRTSINQFIKLADEEDERRLKLEQMQLSIDKTKAEISKITSDKSDAIRVIIEDDVHE